MNTLNSLSNNSGAKHLLLVQPRIQFCVFTTQPQIEGNPKPIGFICHVTS